MKKSPKVLIPSISNLTIPEGLESKILNNLHRKQRIVFVRSFLLNSLSLILTSIFTLSSLYFFVKSFYSSGIKDLISTIISNFDALRPADVLFALLENISLESLASLFASLTLLFSLILRNKKYLSIHHDQHGQFRNA